MKFVKQSFMGIELDVLVGYPEHDILFIATQVAEASGLQSPRQSVSKTRQQHGSGAYLSEVIGLLSVDKPKDSVGRNIKSNTVMFTEAETYQMLLRGHAPQSEPFRKWVTEVVLPSIRKTGKYNAEDSQNPITIGIMDRLKSLRGEIVCLRPQKTTNQPSHGT